MSHMVSAVFDSEHDAQAAVDDLRHSGIPESAISIARHDAQGGSAADADRHPDAGTERHADAADAGKGALTGLGVGAGVGALFGLAAALIPGIGPFITAGALASALGTTAGGAVAGAIVGGASGGLAGALSHYGLNEAESRYYAGEVERGATFVSVRFDDASADLDTVQTVFERHHGRSMSTSGDRDAAGQTGVVSDADMEDFMTDRNRSQTGHRDAMSGVDYDRNYSDDELTDITEDQRRYLRASDEERMGFNYNDQERQTLRLHEERLQATRRPVQAGEVGIRKEVVTESQTIDVPTTREEVVIERHPASGRETMDVSDLQPGEEIRVPVMQEQVDVTKTAVPTEEVSVSKRQVTENQQVTDTVRREEARLDRSSDNLTVDVDQDLEDDLTTTDVDRTRRNA